MAAALSLVSAAYVRRVIGWLVVSTCTCLCLCEVLSLNLASSDNALPLLASAPWSLGLSLCVNLLLLFTHGALPPMRSSDGAMLLSALSHAPAHWLRAWAACVIAAIPLAAFMSVCANGVLDFKGSSPGGSYAQLLPLVPTAIAVLWAVSDVLWSSKQVPATDMMQAVSMLGQVMQACRLAFGKAARATGCCLVVLIALRWVMPWRRSLSFEDYYFMMLIVFLINVLVHTANHLLLVFLFQPLNWSKIARDTTASTELLRQCLQLGFRAAVKAGEVAEQKELAAAGGAEVSPDMLNGFQAHAKHKPLAWELQVVRQSAIARKLLDNVQLPALLPGPPISYSTKDEIRALPVGTTFVRAMAMMDLMRLARYSRERRQAIYDDATTGKAIASAACTVMDNAVLRLQLLAVYIHQEVLGAKDVVLTSSAGVAPAGGSGNMLPQVNLSGGLQWGAVEALKQAKAAQENSAYASIRRILGMQFGKLATAVYTRVLRATLPDSPFRPIERCELTWAIEAVTLLMQKAVAEDTKGTAQHLLPSMLNSLVALQLALQDYGHAMYCANQKWKRVPAGCSAVTPNDVRAIGVVVDEGITRLLKTYEHVLRFYTFPAAYAGELKARLSML